MTFKYIVHAALSKAAHVQIESEGPKHTLLQQMEVGLCTKIFAVATTEIYECVTHLLYLSEKNKNGTSTYDRYDLHTTDKNMHNEVAVW